MDIKKIKSWQYPTREDMREAIYFLISEVERNDIYKEKLKHFMEGLEIQCIDELIEKSPIELKLIGSVIANRIKDLKLKI